MFSGSYPLHCDLYWFQSMHDYLFVIIMLLMVVLHSRWKGQVEHIGGGISFCWWMQQHLHSTDFDLEGPELFAVFIFSLSSFSHALTPEKQSSAVVCWRSSCELSISWISLSWPRLWMNDWRQALSQSPLSRCQCIDLLVEIWVETNKILKNRGRGLR